MVYDLFSKDIFRPEAAEGIRKNGLFIAESERVARRLFAAKFEVVSCLVSESVKKRLSKEIAALERKGVSVHVGKPANMAKITGHVFHEGILVAARKPARRSVEDIIPPKTRKRIFIAALNGITDPQNVGLIVRNAAAFGATAVMVDKKTCDPYYRKSARVSIGTIFKMPVAYEDELAPKLKWLRKEKGARIVVTSPGAGSVDVSKADLSGNVCVVLGNEGEGADKDITRLADMKVRIPVMKEVESINVACASSVFFYRVSTSGGKK